jgi:hypothetical protein
MINFSRFGVSETPELEKTGPLPAGIYLCEIVDFAEREGRNESLTIITTLRVVEGGYSRRLIWDWILVAHLNPVAAGYGRRRLKSLLDASGKPDAANESEVVGQIVKVELEVRSLSDGKEVNQVTAYSSIQPGSSAVLPGLDSRTVPPWLQR